MSIINCCGCNEKYNEDKMDTSGCNVILCENCKKVCSKAPCSNCMVFPRIDKV